MKDWKEYKIENIAEVIGGGTPKTSVKEYWGGEIGWITPRDLSGYNKTYISRGERNITQLGLKKSSAKLMPTGTVLMSSRAPIGYLAIASNEISTNQGFKSLVVNPKKANNLFIYYWLKANMNYIKSNGTGSTFSEISGSVVKSLNILLPPLSEQKAIAGVLSSLDDKIDLLHRQNETLEEMAETLFRQWFVEEAKEDWEEMTLGSIIDIFGGYSYKGNKIGQGSSYLLGMGCVSYSYRFLYSGMRKYDEEVNNKYLVEKGDIVIATRQQSDNLPILGAPAIIPEIDKNYKVIVGTNLYKVVNNSNLNYYSLYRLLKSTEYKNFIKSNAKGSTVRMITKDAILSFPILLPPNNTVNKLNKELSSINNKIELNNYQIQTLTQLRDTLLPKLMSGEVRVEM